jgi:hypothetical protein
MYLRGRWLEYTITVYTVIAERTSLFGKPVMSGDGHPKLMSRPYAASGTADGQ